MKDEPVLNAAVIKFLAGVVAMFATKYLPTLGLTDAQAMAAATSLFGAAVAVISWITRGKVAPMSKLAAIAPEAHAAYMAMTRKS